MERNVDKIKRLEHELGRWHKKVADTAKENEKLREALERIINDGSGGLICIIL